MATAEELLAAMEADPEAYTAEEIVCTIDPETRTISVPQSLQLLGVESDQEVTRLSFRCPKIVGDNIDLSALNLRINYQNAGGELDIYRITDMAVDGFDITFSWRLDRKVTAYKGTPIFAFCAKKPLVDGTLKNEWNTTPNKECKVLEGLEAEEAIVNQNPDILESILTRLDTLENGGGSGAAGRQVELRNSGTAIQWKYEDSETWIDLIQISEIKGEQGTQGINLLPNTKTMKDYAKNANVTLDKDSEGFTVGTFAASTTLAWNFINTRQPMPFSVIRGKTVTFSLHVRSDDWEELNADTSHGLAIAFSLCTETSLSRNLYGIKSLYTTPLSDSWQKIVLTATLTDDYFTSGTGNIDDNTRIFVQVHNYSVYSMQVKKFKLEIGTVKNPVWTPAVEDLQGVNGKSAYEYAQDGGYTGTELEFATKLAKEYAELVEKVAMTTEDTTAEIQPNKLYVFPEMAALSLTFAAPTDNSIVNEYHFMFTSGSTATTLTIPDTIKIPDGFMVDVNKIYELSVLEGCLSYMSWDVAEVTA